MPKQFLLVKDKPILIHSLQKALDWNLGEIVIVIHPDFISLLKEKVKQYLGETMLQQISITEGGKNRFESVQNGLLTIQSKADVVGIHDAVRPCYSQQLALSTFDTAYIKGAAVPMIEVRDSYRQINEDESSSVVDRSKLRIVQTPQCFHFGKLKEAYKAAANSDQTAHKFTDDASVWEWHGAKVFSSNGSYENIKITYPADIKFAEQVL